MIRFAKHQAIKIIDDAWVIPLFYHRDPAIACCVADTLVESGCNVVEFTNRGEGALAAFRQLSAHMRKNSVKSMLGAGSVHDPYVASQFLAEGADFIVGACFNAELARLCNRHGVLYIPGCGSVTEIMTATESGSDIVKIFPADALGGPSFIKAVRGPLPWLRAIPAGGVKASHDSLSGWFEAGAFAVCMGSDLVSATILNEKNFADLATATTKTIEIVRKLRRR